MLKKYMNIDSFKFGGLILAAFVCSDISAQEVPPGVWVRPGFNLSIAESSIKAPRFMEFDSKGTLYVSVPREGKIYACRDKDGDGKYETVTTFLEGHEPNKILQGMQWHEDALWVAEISAIYKCKDTDGDGKVDDKVKVISEDKLPITGGGHRWRALLIHKNRIYTHVGDQANATDEPIEAGERKKIWSFAMDGSDKKLFANGVRNTEKFVIRPGTEEIWGVDHDVDDVGASVEGKEKKFGQPITDHNPPAELNKYVEGGFYGHPFIVGKNLPNLMFLNHTNLAELASKAVIPEWTMAAHCAGNGMIFYSGDKIPNAKGDAFVAMRGSWNATRKTGYCLSRILFENGKPYGEQKMINFLAGGSAIAGRPVDCVQAPDGSILVSDDTGNKIYRLSYSGSH
jgi:glucose/arabinose dehydrogenase